MQPLSTSEVVGAREPRPRRRARPHRRDRHGLRSPSREAIDAIEALVARGQAGRSSRRTSTTSSSPRRTRDSARPTRTPTSSLVDGTPGPLGRSRAGVAAAREGLRAPISSCRSSTRGAAHGWRVYLLGAAPGVADRVKAHPRARLPRAGDRRHELAEHRPRERRLGAEATILERGSATATPDLLFLALGPPKQEIWAHRIRETMKPDVMLGVGASFDFVAGTAKRSPRGSRWSGSSGSTGSRTSRRLWKRYLVRDPKFLAILLRDLRTRRR